MSLMDSAWVQGRLLKNGLTMQSGSGSSSFELPRKKVSAASVVIRLSASRAAEKALKILDVTIDITTLTWYTAIKLKLRRLHHEGIRKAFP